jgi:hypothetical protein
MIIIKKHDNNAQFVQSKSTKNQETYLQTKEVFTLVVNQGTNRNDNMKIHPHAIPCPMEWPTTQYYKANGRYIPMPSEWATQNKMLMKKQLLSTTTLTKSHLPKNSDHHLLENKLYILTNFIISTKDLLRK